MREQARRIPANVRAVSVVSLVNDLASELAYPVVPLFVTAVLGAPVAVLGLIEGIAEGSGVALGAASGWISDRAGGRRVPWITAGYTVSAGARGRCGGEPLGSRAGRSPRRSHGEGRAHGAEGCSHPRLV